LTALHRCGDFANPSHAAIVAAAYPQPEHVDMGSQHPKIEALHKDRLAATNHIEPFRVGDTVRVHYKVVEGDKERVQIFQGQVIRRRRGGVGATFTVRKISYNVGVERIFPLHSPRIDRVELVSRGMVRRSKLYFLRNLEGKAARLRDAREKAAMVGGSQSMPPAG
jgi:large subunit ribosomal protein L19